MSNTKEYGYMRVSAKEQKEDRQRIALIGAGVPEKNIYMDKQSGKDFEREQYKKLLKKGGRIIQKTDDRDFFEFSLEEYEACGFTLENKTYHLHEKGNPEWNVVTEYEAKWVERGLPIHRVEAKLEV